MTRSMLVVLIVFTLLGLATTATATVEHYYYSTDGVGTFSHELTAYGTISHAIQYNNDGAVQLYAHYYFTMHKCDYPPNSTSAINTLGYGGWTGHGKHCAELPYSNNSSFYPTTMSPGNIIAVQLYGGSDGKAQATITTSLAPSNTISGTTSCVDEVSIYVYLNGDYHLLESKSLSTPDSYTFTIFPQTSYRVLFDGAYHDFICDGTNVVFDYDACIWVYGYTCGVDTIKLYNDTGGWILDDSVGQSTGYDVYEMIIEAGEDYKISFIDSTIDGDFVVHNQTFSCTGDHVLIDFDRCEWVYPPNGPDIPIYLWTGYDYNVVIFKDNHGNMVENAEIAVYDNTDNTYLQKWTGNKDGYTLLGAKFNTDHDVLLMLRTFDGVFTLDTVYPANGSAVVGEEDITTTNWTIPIKYNLNVLPVDQCGAALFDVFCGLSEYTPLNPGAFWGMDLSDQGYVPVTNCSGFAMCDIIAEKDGYADYKVEALNWTSKSAMVKDYRHNVVMAVEV